MAVVIKALVNSCQTHLICKTCITLSRSSSFTGPQIAIMLRPQFCDNDRTSLPQQPQHQQSLTHMLTFLHCSNTDSKANATRQETPSKQGLSQQEQWLSNRKKHRCSESQAGAMHAVLHHEGCASARPQEEGKKPIRNRLGEE